LNARQRAFVDHYTGGPDGVRGNATKAAAKAGYKHPNVQGPRLLVNVGVGAAIRARQEAAAEAAALSLEGFVDECLQQAQWWREHDARPDATSCKALELAGKALGYLDRSASQDPFNGTPRAVELMKPWGVALMEKQDLPAAN
jgi:hypothetical protein